MHNKTGIDPLGAPAYDAASLFSGSVLQSRYFRDVGISLLCLAGTVGLVYCPTVFDVPFTHMVNTWAGKGTILNAVFFDIDEFPTCGGVMFLAILWACWFSMKAHEEDDLRSRLLAEC